MKKDVFSDTILEIAETKADDLNCLREVSKVMDIQNQTIFMLFFQDMAAVVAIYMVAYHRAMRDLEGIEELERMLERE